MKDPMTKSMKTLQAEMTYAFHRYIRLRDLRKGCISCTKPATWGHNWDAGHYYTKGSVWAALAYDEENVNGQCKICNRNEGNKQGYALGLVERYGADILERLRIKLASAGSHHWDRFHYVVMIEQYQKKFAELEKYHGIKPGGVKRHAKKKVPTRFKSWAHFAQNSGVKPRARVIDMDTF